MQKAIIIQTRGFDTLKSLEASELNEHLSDGWKVIQSSPFGCSVAEGGETESGRFYAAILVIIEK